MSPFQGWTDSRPQTLENIRRPALEQTAAILEPCPVSNQKDQRPEDGQDDIFSQLEKLTALFDKGILSKDEFEAKKQELLRRI